VKVDRWHQLVHVLYDPVSLGRRSYRTVRWLSWVHLIPGSWLERSCRRYEEGL
jgi:hypothetical protein